VGHQGLMKDTATGLWYDRARWYSDQYMRAISADPLGYPDGANRYAMYAANPINRLDPTGLAAWKHTSWWDDSWKKKYRDYVNMHAQDYLGRTEDCADLSMTLLIDFAAANGLPVTLRVDTGHLIISKSCKWSNKDDFLEFVKRKIGSKALFDQNTGPALKEEEIRAGDLIISTHHTALVVKAMKPGESSFGQILSFDETTGGPVAYQQPFTQLWDDAAAKAHPGQLQWIYNPESTAGYRVDYLNHTGFWQPYARMKYNQLDSVLIADGYQFRFWHDIVFSNYKTWTGTTKLAGEL
jgi:RHS repeat-associated protein